MKRLALIAAVCAVVGAAAFWFLTRAATVSAAALPQYAPNIDNGRTMFDIGGCASRHASPDKDPHKVDRTRLGGGLPLKTPFGTFYTPNISPDPTHRIGSWGEADFVSA